MARYVVLLRAINVGGRTAPMAELRDACLSAGFVDVASYIQSGNLVLTSELAQHAVEASIEALIVERFGFTSEAIARTAAEWSAYAGGSAFPDAEARGSQLHLCLSKRPPLADSAERLLARATLGERIKLAGDALWIDYAGGVGRSKLTPALLDRSVGSPVTVRNWNTVRKLQELLG